MPASLGHNLTLIFLFNPLAPMKNTLKLVAALALTGLCFQATAQTAKPTAKGTKMESKSEEKMETPKEEKMENGKENKSMKHGGGMHHAKKTGAKSKM